MFLNPIQARVVAVKKDCLQGVGLDVSDVLAVHVFDVLVNIVARLL